jgi:hypothetical protein
MTGISMWRISWCAWKAGRSSPKWLLPDTPPVPVGARLAGESNLENALPVRARLAGESNLENALPVGARLAGESALEDAFAGKPGSYRKAAKIYFAGFFPVFRSCCV